MTAPTPRPLAAQLAALELSGPLMVHASLRRVGAVAGGAQAVATALREALGPHGTLVVPTFTPENSDTSTAYRENVRGMSEEEARRFREEMAPFEPEVTPTLGMGVLAETVRRLPEALRSDHPQTSFAAIGPAADAITARHSQDCHLGEESPLARLYELDAHVLLLGVGFDVLTVFHLAEYRVSAPPRRTYRCVIRGADGARRWWEYEDVALDDGDFADIGADFAREPGLVRRGRLGGADCRVLRVRDAVDFATRWLPAHRAHA